MWRLEWEESSDTDRLLVRSVMTAPERKGGGQVPFPVPAESSGLWNSGEAPYLFFFGGCGGRQGGPFSSCRHPRNTLEPPGV